ncbi:MAG: hypothetical protein ACK5QC_16585 [Bacteroidota bacterium]
MYSQFKKRKKTTFKNYKAVRTSIHLNNSSFEPIGENDSQYNLLNNWENQWIEQLNELSPGPIKSTTLKNKRNKLIVKWWENN